MLTRLLTVAMAAGFSCVSDAACNTPTANAGARKYFTSPGIYRLCDGTNWLDFHTNGTAGTCSGAGKLDYDSTAKIFKFCDGSNWIRNEKPDCTLTGGSFSISSSLNNGTYLDGPAALERSADNNHLFVVAWNYVSSWNKTAMPTINSTVVDTIYSTDFQEIAGAVKVGNYLYVATRKINGVAVINVADPANITYNTAHKVTHATEMNNIGSVVADPGGQYLYTNSFNSGSACWIHVISIASPTAPTIVGKVSLTASTGSVWCSLTRWAKSNVLAVSYGGGLATIDVTTKTAPVVADYTSVAASAQAEGLAITPDGNTAYTVSQLGNDKFCVWNITTPSSIPNPTCYAHASFEEAYSAVVAGKYVLYTSETSNLFGAVSRISPGPPVASASDSTQLLGASPILLDGRYAIVGSYASTRVTVVDMSCDPMSSVMSLGSCSIAGQMEYDSGAKTLQWCDGTNWYPMAN